MPESPGWTSPTERLPRLNQDVQVLTRSGTHAVATFRVHHTDHWPSGASWHVDGHEVAIPFGDVVAWATTATRLDAAGAGAASAAPEPATPEGPPALASADGPPAIAREALAEVEATRHVVASAPSSGLLWAPHPDLPTVLAVGVQIVRLVSRIEVVLTESTYDAAWPEPGVDATDRLTLQREFGLAAEATARAVAATTLANIVAPWTLLRDGVPVLTRARGDVLRQLALSPLVHVRGQFSLYLRTLGVAVPPLYPAWQTHVLHAGPSP